MNLSSNNLIAIPYIQFFSNLKILNLSKNRLQNVNFAFLRNDENFDNLTQLDLSYNKIKDLDLRFYQKIYNVTSLDLSFNDLTHITQDILILKRVKWLDLTGNFIETFPTFFAHSNISEIRFDWAFYTKIRSFKKESDMNLKSKDNEINEHEDDVVGTRSLHMQIFSSVVKNYEKKKLYIDFFDYAKYAKFIAKDENLNTIFELIEKAIQR